MYRFSIKSLMLFTGLVALLIYLNLFPPPFFTMHAGSNPPSNTAGAKYYGWPFCMVAEFEEERSGKKGLKRLIERRPILQNILIWTCLVVIVLAIIDYRKRYCIYKKSIRAG